MNNLSIAALAVAMLSPIARAASRRSPATPLHASWWGLPTN